MCDLESVASLQGCTIATLYPNTLKYFLDARGIQSQVVVMHGSVKMAPKIGIANAICDLVSTEWTLIENGLQEIEHVLDSQAVLVGNPDAVQGNKRVLLDQLLLRMKGVIHATTSKCIMLHVDKEKLPLGCKALPGRESTTVVELRGMSSKVALHAVSREDVFWNTIKQLKSLGATSILVVPIEKSME
ncbi:ATP phosphoribosyltransferase [Pajaroellobacter abortibovis]|nr:ATP phosphoribosyltransferase [Pajaroellobacter abortibovis]